MKVTLTHDGKSVELDLTAEQMSALGLKEEKKKTGYERGEFNNLYFTVPSTGDVTGFCDHRTSFDNLRFDNADYYSDKELAEVNARADRLMRQLRRFAAENGGIPSVEDWNNHKKQKYNIAYCYRKDNDHYGLFVGRWAVVQFQGSVFFDSEEAATRAIEKFHDELIWYFTEYEAMLR